MNLDKTNYNINNKKSHNNKIYFINNFMIINLSIKKYDHN